MTKAHLFANMYTSTNSCRRLAIFGLLASVSLLSQHPVQAQMVVEADPNFVASPRSYGPRDSIYQWDDGTATTNFRIISSSFGWMHMFTVVPGADIISSISVAWGLGSNTLPGRIAVWEDPNDDGNPNDAVLLTSTTITCANAGTNIFNVYALPTPVKVSGTFFIGAVVDTNGAGIFPMPLDVQTGTVGRLWLIGNGALPVDIVSLAANVRPPTEWTTVTSTVGYALLRATGTNLGITYQGELKEAGILSSSPVDLRFSLFSGPTDTIQIGATVIASGVTPVDGKFTVELPFAADEFGTAQLRYLLVEVSPAGAASYVALSPRQKLTPSPQAHYALTAARADSAGTATWISLTGVPAGFADDIDNDSGGDITAVTAGAGLTGGATTGAASLAVSFAGNGVAATAARSDHAHDWTSILNIPAGFADGTDNDSGGDITSVSANIGLSGGGTSGALGLDVDFAGTGSAQTSSRSDNYHSSLAASDGNPLAAVSVDAAGLVTINSTAPTLPLTIGGSFIGGTAAAVTGGAILVTSGSASTQGMRIGYQGIQNVFSDGSAGTLKLNPVGGGIAMFSATDPLDSVLFVEGAIHTTGVVGVGTTTPEGPLHVFESSAGVVTANASSTLVLERDGTNYLSILSPAASGSGVLFGTPTNNADGSVLYNIAGDRALRLRTGGNVNRIVVSSTGRVGIGRDSTANLLEVEGTASKVAAGSWLANSDARIKTGVLSITNALDTLDKVRLVSFEYSPWYLAQHPGIANGRYLNVIAQEFAQVFPDAVKSSGEKLADGSDILQVDTYPLTIYAAAGVQELHTLVRAGAGEVDSLKARLSAAEGELAALRVQQRELLARLKRLEAKDRAGK